MLSASVSGGLNAQGSLTEKRDDLLAWAVVHTPLSQQCISRLQDLEKQSSQIEQRIVPPSPALAAADGSGENERVHIRGNYRTPGPKAIRN